ncbi:benzoylformate decarboxylase [Streptomyces lavendulae]|uniref:benzoylformate decarboxylase n=1 Tax=Streptomyces lavendulae TaxID=1914 RepID=UPI0036E075B5
MTTVREAVFALLRRHGMTTVFGTPGSTELPFLAGLPDDFSYILGLNEAVAASMADGYAQASRRPTLLSLHTAAGLGNAMGSLVNAAASCSPVVVLVGQQVRELLPSGALLSNAHPHTLPLGAVKFTAEPARAQDVPTVLAQAIHRALLTPAGPVCVSVPMDDWARECDPDALAPVMDRRVIGRSVLGPDSYGQLLLRVMAARRPALVVGAEMDTELGFTGAALLAERLHAPVWMSGFASRCAFPTEHGLFRGPLPVDSASIAAALHGHDLVLALGCPVFAYYPYVQGAPLTDGVEVLAVTSDPGIAARAVAGDAYLGAPDGAVQSLLSDLPSSCSAFPATPAARQLRQPVDSGRLGADAVFEVLGEALPQGAVVVNEAYRQLPQLWGRVALRRPGSFYSAGALGLGFGLPAAIGIQLAEPERPVIAVIGDGSLQYTVQALWTAAHYSVPLTVLALNNGEYAILKDWAHRLDGADAPGLDLPGIDLVAIASGYGVAATRVKSCEELREALERTNQSSEPGLVEVTLAHVPYRWNAESNDIFPQPGESL